MARHRPGSSPITPLHHLRDLTLDPKNANRGTRRGRQALAASLTIYGAGRSVLADRAGRIVAGNKTIEQARALGLPITVVPTDGSHLVVVQRTDLDLQTDPRAQALAIADNRIAELDLDWDPAVLAQLRADGLDVAAWWTEDEWTTLTGAAALADPAEDQVLAPGPTTIRRGDLETTGFALRAQIIWYKQHFALSRGDYLSFAKTLLHVGQIPSSKVSADGKVVVRAPVTRTRRHWSCRSHRATRQGAPALMASSRTPMFGGTGSAIYAARRSYR